MGQEPNTTIGQILNQIDLSFPIIGDSKLNELNYQNNLVDDASWKIDKSKSCCC